MSFYDRERRRRIELARNRKWWYIKDWDRIKAYGDKCYCGHNHRIAILSNGKELCPCIWWARTAYLILYRKNNEEMGRWIEDNPIENYLRRIDGKGKV